MSVRLLFGIAGTHEDAILPGVQKVAKALEQL
jgi:hypothetical protein